MNKIIITLLFVLGLAQSAMAQITAEVITLYRQGSTTPLSAPIVLDRTQRVCGQPLGAVPGLIVNPRRLEYPDPLSPTTACVWTDPGNGFLSLLAPDATTLEATIRFRTSAGDGPEGPRSNPFIRVPTPGQVRVRQ